MIKWRRERDSNPRIGTSSNLNLSKDVHSATLPSLHNPIITPRIFMSKTSDLDTFESVLGHVSGE